jgi:hypothetical protein
LVCVVDFIEHVEGLLEALDDDARSFHRNPPLTKKVSVILGGRLPMDLDFLQTMTINNEFCSVPGQGEDSLVGQTFPDKDSAD